MGHDDSTTVDLTQHDGERQPEYGQEGSPENPNLYMKYAFEDVGSLGDLVSKISEFQQHIEALREAGWELSEPINDGHMFVAWKGKGAPPEQWRAEVRVR